VLGDVFDTRADLDYPAAESVSKGATALLEWQLNGNLTIKNILAWRENETSQQIDFDSLPVVDFQSPYLTEDDQFSEELQLLWSGHGFDALLGFYYLDASASNEFDVLLGQTGDLIGLPGLNAYTFGEVDTETWSLFGDVTLRLDELFGRGLAGLELSLGGRWTDDERSARILRQTFIGGSTEAFGGSPTLIATTSDFSGSETFEDFTPRVSLSWHANDEQTLYVSWAEGFKGGSFDPRGATTAAPDLDNDGTVSEAEVLEFMTFDPEEITTIELGLKSTWADQRITTRLAVFDSDYEDVQIPGSIGVDTDGDGIADTFAGVTTNAGKASLTGLEFEGSALLAIEALTGGDTLTAQWTFGWIDAEYDEYIIAVTDPATGATALQDVSGQRAVQNTPEYTGSLSLTYARPLELLGRGGELSLIPLASYRDDTQQFEVASPIDQDAYWLFDLSVVWTSNDGRVSAGLHGRNLTDEEYRVSGYDFVNIPNPLGLEGTVTAFYGDPRTISGTLQLRF
jgi:iron complex outermembrane receptor protein